MEFIPTYLYIKRHKITGLMYFGKTIQDPFTYCGSGKKWLNHLKTYGYEIETLWVKLFYSKKDISTFAKTFSDECDIVNSKSWANLKIETGSDEGNRTLRGIPETFSKREKLKILSGVYGYMKRHPDKYTFDELIKIKVRYYLNKKMRNTICKKIEN